ncbi:tRNA 2-thiouridine(34) synthase MnmA [Conexibacter sp. JD483]|uniref:tRNA 2-thiouridine(34) synthase MnmA n=1 Tax=unclassified Conexibacter TaxID=2627773 RepID=UPI002728BAC3|nr:MULTISPECIES: tRNA 2-thiouridine(34) synthase MnmA [unclassified Conexibacter]MDO8185038.1 tRNA 2-thiouridine(34) synthase MnmA [Conexibacter sp. CPCC 205706]MDO8196748.1 tRNA 2-thiouridine(34) synthase MnmA [Conexibacter sp. CPCC 205762]MDR9367996.1 tRNA 2-thiouridine(34) synthase MnmA [Conexibacter sp. JD483]
MDRELFEHHLISRHGHGRAPAGAALGVAGTRLCGDVVRVALALDAGGTRVGALGWEAEACGATLAALSATAELVEGMELRAAARLGAHDLAEQLGGLSAGKFHAAELVADALARALGTAVREQGALPGPADGERTLVAMSGGVDSAVVALLAGRDGGDAVAVTLELWADEENDGERSCCSAQAVRHARALAHRMGLPHFTLDLRAEFRAGVVDPFLEDHRAGLTPNPCIRCNGHVRLDAMLDFADRLGAATLATGHYARVEAGAGDGAPPLLRAAVDAWKDQTYMLAALAPGSLARMRFPLGELTKPQVRALAAEAELPVASKPDSQDLCFLAGTSRSEFLVRHAGIEQQPGEIVDSSGRVLGRHRGHQGYTVGQRRGLGVAAEEPLYVLRTEAAGNRVVAGPRAELETTSVPLRGARLHRDGARVDRVKLRYRAKPLPARLVGEPAAGAHRRLEVALEQPVDGAAPGQLACLLDGDVVIGWATIDRPPLAQSSSSG